VLGDDDSSIEDEEEEVTDEDYSYSEYTSSVVDECSTIATRSYHFVDNFLGRSATNGMNQQQGTRATSSRNDAPAFCETIPEEMELLSDPEGKMERSFSKLDLNRDRSGFHSSLLLP
jgi:hypothetical protein